MKIGILEAGVPPAALVPEHGTYASMTQRLLGEAHAYRTFRVWDGELPADAGVCDAYAVTGSRSGVHDGDPWIAALIAFLLHARNKARLVGICFGHQVMAQAFGGRVERAPNGWGVGLGRYEIIERAGWMDAAEAVHIAASHQDQVVAPPPACRVLGASAFTPFAILAYAEHPSMSVQFHPEFSPDFARALLYARRDDIPADRVERARASFDAANDNARLGAWINRFLAPERMP